MNRSLHGPRRFLLLAATVLGLGACSDGASPTEPGAPRATAVPASTPLPVPIVVAGQPASLAGRVRSYGRLEPGTTIECQGRLTTASADGAYSLPDLVSGQTTVRVTYRYLTPRGAAEFLEEPITLFPGANQWDPLVY